MTKQDIKDKIAKINKGLASGQLEAEDIAALEEKKEELQKQLDDMEEAEKPAAKPAAEAKATPAATPSALSGKSKSELERDIKNVKAALSGVTNPKIKEALEKKLALFEAELEGKEEDKKVEKLEKQAEKKIKEVEKKIASPKTPAKVKAVAKKKVEAIKKVVKEAKKDAEQEKVARRRGRPRKAEAIKKVAAKRGRPAKAAAAKPAKAAPVKAVKKPVVKRKTKAVVKLQRAVSSLEKLVRRSKELRALYAGKGVDLDRDAARGAKKPGWRLAGTNRRPTRADIKAGRAYWEGRGNRADIQKSKVPKLAKGGMMAKGGEVEELQVLYMLNRNSRFHLSVEKIAEELGLSNPHFKKYATDEQLKDIKKDADHFVSKGYVKENEYGYRITPSGAEYLRQVSYRQAAEEMEKRRKSK